jgi:dTDP-4-amino-4,6-dideoxygalactose transaminase
LKNDIKTEIHYPVPPNGQPAMKGILDEQPAPLAAEIHQTTLSLPISSCHTEADIRRVVDTMNRFS